MKRPQQVLLPILLLGAASICPVWMRAQTVNSPAVNSPDAGIVSTAPPPASPVVNPNDANPSDVNPSPAGLTAAPGADADRLSAGEIGVGVFYALPGSAASDSFRAHAGQIGVIAPQSYALDSLGRLRGSLPEDLAEIARQRQVAIMPLVINAGFSRLGAIRMLRSPGARDRAVGALVEEARDLDLAGWQIDFENMPSSSRTAFSRFVSEASIALHRHGKLLSVAVGARTQDDPDSVNYRTFSGVYDYAALGASADFLSVMAYPESDATHPGPLASYPWVEQVVQHVLLEVPADKISLGLPTYQSDWTERRVRISVRRRVQGHIEHTVRYIYRLFHHNGPVTVEEDELEWDPVLKSSYRIEGSGHTRHITWVEDDRSFYAKLQLVSQYHLRGFSVWRIGLEDQDIWDQMPDAARAAEAIEPPPAPQLPALIDTLQPVSPAPPSGVN